MASTPIGSIKIGDVMTTDVVKISTNGSAYDAAHLLLSRGVGCVIVVDDRGKDILGIITKGDILRKTMLEELDPKQIPAEKVMTHPVATIDPESTLEQAAHLMVEKRVTKLPVLKSGELVGIITSTDIITAEPVHVRYLQELVRAKFANKTGTSI